MIQFAKEWVVAARITRCRMIIPLTFTPLDPIRALYWSAVINGLLAALLIALMVAIGMNRRIMGDLRMPWWMALGGGITAAIMASVAVVFFVV
jgi:Mn2+/Fe2+ NRAMP family transporter